jgi:hypothetical protein
MLEAVNGRCQIDLDIEISHAWTEASADLGIRVVAPFTLTVEGEDTFLYEAHILDFGAPKGTVVRSQTNDSGKNRSSGYFYSTLYPSYRKYSRQLFIDTLNDWGWFGPKDREPPWYTGKPWGYGDN